MRPLHWLIAILGAGFIHLALAYGFVSAGTRPVDSTISAESQGVKIQLSAQGADWQVEAEPEPPKPEPVPEKPPQKQITKTEPKPVKPDPVVVQVAKVEAPQNALLIRQEERKPDTPAKQAEPFPETQTAPERTLASVAKTMDREAETSNPGAQSVVETAEYLDARNNYFARLMGTLQRNKRYPKEAKKKKEQGTVMLQFSINKRGDILAANIAQSSGHLLLDEAALQMLRKASPLPSIPDSLAQQQLEITIPVEYSLITK